MSAAAIIPTAPLFGVDLAAPDPALPHRGAAARPLDPTSLDAEGVLASEPHAARHDRGDRLFDPDHQHAPSDGADDPQRQEHPSDCPCRHPRSSLASVLIALEGAGLVRVSHAATTVPEL